MIDLHAHTTASDGSLTPTELVALARETGLSALGVTDHDTVGGLAEATAAAHSGVSMMPSTVTVASISRVNAIMEAGSGSRGSSPTA